MGHIVATYHVKVTVRAEGDGATAIPIDALTAVVEQSVTAAYAEADPEPVTVNATAERTDK